MLQKCLPVHPGAPAKLAYTFYCFSLSVGSNYFTIAITTNNKHKGLSPTPHSFTQKDSDVNSLTEKGRKNHFPWMQIALSIEIFHFFKVM